MSKAIGAARLSSENSRGQVAPPRSPQPKIPMCRSPTINLRHRSCQRQSNTPKRPRRDQRFRSEEHTSELQSLMRISDDVFCLKKKKQQIKTPITRTYTN